MSTRVQLSLFVSPSCGQHLEVARRLLDPVQAKLIPAHVTLCRDDEVRDFDPGSLRSVIASSGAGPISLRFGNPEVFHGHGVLLPCIEGEEEFHRLRCRLLGSTTIQRHAPHITIAHPRNPRSPQNTPANLGILRAGLVIRFAEVSHIRQEAASAWQVIERQPLLGSANNDA